MALVSPDGRFLKVNRSFCEITGRTETELLSTDFQTITHPDDLSLDLYQVNQLLAGEIESYRMEKRYLHSQGHLVWVLLSVSLVRDEGGAPVCFVSQVEDISERKRLETDLLTTNEEVRRVMEGVPDSILRYDRNGRVLYVNSAACARWGVPRERLLGNTLAEAGFPPQIAANGRENLRRAFETGEKWVYEQSHFDGAAIHHYRVQLFPEKDESGHFESVLVVSHEVTEQKEAQRELQEAYSRLKEANANLEAMALIDPVTGVRNRRYFNLRLRQESSEAERTGRPCCLILADLDHFKSLNDTIGHAGGDEVLRISARLLEGALRPSDIVARFGGEEFAIILADTAMDGGLQAAERCRVALADYSWPNAKVTASFGVAVRTGTDDQAWLARADLALYEAKFQGRNRVCPVQFGPAAIL